MLHRRTSLPSVTFLLLVAMATIGTAATTPSGWRGPYKVSGTAKAFVNWFGDKETVQFPITRTMTVYGQKLDIGNTTYTYQDSSVTFQRSRLIQWREKNGGYNAFATAPVLVDLDGDQFTVNGKFIGRVAENSNGRPVLQIKFTAFGQVSGVKINVTVPLKGVQK